MAQSRLENIAIDKREDLVLQNEYVDDSITEGKEYNEDHSDAISNGDALGKGNGQSMGFAVADENSFSILKNGTRSQKMNYSSLPTKENDSQTIGGLYDREGRDNISHSGRNRLVNMNKYSANNEYGENSVDTSDNVIKGQYVVR